MFGIVCLTTLTFHLCLDSKSRSVVLIFRIFALFVTELELFDFNLCANLYHFTALLAPVYAFCYYYSVVDVRMILCRAVTQSGYANEPCHLLLNK